MALKVWLPLNGNLENKGISDATIDIVGNGVNVNDQGKIGKCYQWTVDNSYLKTTSYCNNIFQDNDNFTLACWVYLDSLPEQNTGILCCSQYYSSSGGGGIGIYLNANGLIRIVSASTSNSYEDHGNFYLSVNQWVHLAYTFSNNGNIKKLYVNGIEHKEIIGVGNWTVNNRQFIIGGNGQSGWYHKFKGKINDVRIYDHCLSPKEVKEISQGLVLHYKLDGWCGGVGENLLSGTKDYSNWYLGARWTKNNGILTYSAGSTTWNDADSPCIPWSSVENKSLTISVDLRSDDYNYSSSDGFSLCLVRKSSGPEAQNYSNRRRECTPIHKGGNEITNVWQTFTYTYTNFNDSSFINTYNGGGGDWFGVYLWNYCGKSIQVKNIKIEIGNEATAWCPIISEMGIDTTKVSDSSGYGNDGIVTGILDNSNLTPRYKLSTKLVDNASSIKIGNLSTLVSDGIFTFNIWFKKNTGEWSSKAWETILGGPSGFELEGKLSSSQNAYIHPYSWGGGSTSSPNSYSIQYTLDEWHMLTMVRTTSNTKFYLDGELKITGNAGSIPSGDYFIGAWKTATQQNYKGYFSDARIYTTALSEEDIRELYQIPANIDNLGNMHGFEFVSNESENLFDFSFPWTYENLTGTVENDDKIGSILKLTTSSTNQRAYKNVSNIWTTNGKSFVVSFLAKATANGVTCEMSRSVVDLSKTFTLTTNWVKYVGIIKLTGTSSAGTLSFRIHQSGATVYLAHVKLMNADESEFSVLKNGIVNTSNMDETDFEGTARILKESGHIMARSFIEK